ncbi:MAG: 4-alpha-glucanotransferase [Bacillota bacterium]
MVKDPDLQLHRLARLYGIETAYNDAEGRRQHADPETLLAALQGLGAPVSGMTDVTRALQERRYQQWQIHCETVIATWQGKPLSLKLRLPENNHHLKANLFLELETGEVKHWEYDLSRLSVLCGAQVDGIKYVELRLDLPSNLPCGYHRLTIHINGRISSSLIILAPRLAYFPSQEKEGRIWGLFLPLYALHSRHSWGAGDFSDLKSYLDWAMVLGNGTVGTLPLLASFLEEPFDPSPYAPASRLFWNEFYLDVSQIPELSRCCSALDLLNSPEFKRELSQISGTPLVDYRRGMATKRKVLELLSGYFFSGDGERQSALRKWVREHDQAVNYARFRAATEYRKAAWTEWSGPMREGLITEGDYLPENERYHLYVQWLADEQLSAVADQARKKGTGLYMDLPLGVHGAGYDVWHEREAFCLDASCGAPPDPFYNSGQNWGFPPLHPERIRHQGYRYFIDYLHHQLQYAGILRLDHVMGLHHLYWIPQGLSARHGVYVKYRSEEFYAILTLESQRYKTMLVGEDLGTVPSYVRKAMTRHNLHSMYVLPYQFNPTPTQVLNPIPAGALATLNTHDMAPFAVCWSQEGPDRAGMLLKFLRCTGWLSSPVDSLEEILKALIKYMAASRARILLINLEDLWLETAPQNIPGTVQEYPNWQRKARYTLEEFTGMPDIKQLLEEVAQWRKTIL